MRSTSRRRRLSMTSLIDVIFLLLLFFMLSSTFTRFAEVEFAASGPGRATGDAPPVFVTLAETTLRLNGREADMEKLQQALVQYRQGSAPLSVLVAARQDVTAQRLTDLLVALRTMPALRITVMEAT